MSLPFAGEVYYGRYEYPDGGSSIKFMLVLYANPNDHRVITCIATKVPIDKNKNAVCHFKTQRFFIPAGQEYFEVDTYFELLRFKEFSYTDFCSTKSVELKFALSSSTLAQIRECLKKFADDIPSDLLPLIT